MCQCQAPQYCYQCKPAPQVIRPCNAPLSVGSGGTVGPKGDRGPQGFQGIQGPAGPPGPAGTVNNSFAWRDNGNGTWDLLVDGIAVSNGPISFPGSP